MNTSQLTIETKNLILKAISIDYKKDIFREFTPKIATFMTPKTPEKIEDTIEFIEKSIIKNNSGSDLQIVIAHKKNKEFLGCGGIHHIDTKTPEFGIWLKKSAHGHSYGKETIHALKNWADNNLDYEYLIYPVDVKNIASKKIPESLGGKISNEYDKTNPQGKLLHLVEFHIYPSKK